MKIAVASDDKVTVRKGHFGEARYYLVFEADGDKILTEEVRENPYFGDEHEHQRAKKILPLVQDCDVLIGRSMGRHSVPNLVAKGKTPLLSLLNGVTESVEAYLAGDRSKFLVWDEEENKFVKIQSGGDA